MKSPGAPNIQKQNYKLNAKSSGYGQQSLANKQAATSIKEAAAKRANENKNVRNMQSL